MGKIRMSYKDIKNEIKEWNESDSKLPQVRVTAFEGFYRITRKDNKKSVAIAKYPHELSMQFAAWQNGYYEGMNQILSDQINFLEKF